MKKMIWLLMIVGAVGCRNNGGEKDSLQLLMDIERLDRKVNLESAFKLWGVIGTVELANKKRQPGENWIIFSDGDCDRNGMKWNGGDVTIGCKSFLANKGQLGASPPSLDDQTILIRRASYYGLNRDERVAIFAHELGHTFGFMHSENSNDIMYPTIGVLSPSDSERERLKYLPFAWKVHKYFIGDL